LGLQPEQLPDPRLLLLFVLLLLLFLLLLLLVVVVVDQVTVKLFLYIIVSCEIFTAFIVYV